MKINELNEGIRVIENYLVVNVIKGTANNGQQYLTVTLQDNTGQIEARVWDANESDNLMFRQGKFVKVVADVIEYRNSLQLKVITSEEVDEANIKLDDYAIASPVSFTLLKAEFERLLQSIQNEELFLITKTLIDRHYEAFLSYPAASRLHHEYTHGLLEHTLTLANIADGIIAYYLKLYSGNWLINRDLVIAAILLHDLGKTIELSGPILTTYTLKGKLLGHISLINAEVLEVGRELKINEETLTLLSHIILSHHGKLEFGSPVVPMTKEAALVSMIDDLDAKMKQIEKALVDTKSGEFSDRLWAFDHTSFYKPKK